MVTSVTSDPAILSNSERSSKPRTEGNRTIENDAPATRSAAKSQAERLEVDNANQFFRMENRQNSQLDLGIETPEQAQNLLGQVLQQLNEMPEKALHAHTSANSAHIGRLLESMA